MGVSIYIQRDPDPSEDPLLTNSRKLVTHMSLRREGRKEMQEKEGKRKKVQNPHIDAPVPYPNNATQLRYIYTIYKNMCTSILQTRRSKCS